MKRRLIILSYALFTLVLWNKGSVSLAQSSKPAKVCSLPVCDIPGTLATLRSQTQNARFQFLSNLKVTYAKNQDTGTQENLLEFSKLAKKLMIELKEEDYLVREASYIADNAIVSLMKYSYTDAKRLIAFYPQLTSPEQRYAVLDFWDRKIDTIKDAKTIYGFLDFPIFAQKYSIDLEDEAYIPEAAADLSSKIATILLDINADFEGVFDLKNKSQSGEDYRLIVFNTRTPDLGIIASLISKPTGLSVGFYQNMGLNAKGTVLSGPSADSSASSGILKISKGKNTSEITGSYLDAESFEEVPFVAARLAQVLPTNGSDACTVESLPGRYVGIYAGKQGSFSITYLDQVRLAATFISDDKELRINFKVGSYSPAIGRLTFIVYSNQKPIILRLIAKNAVLNGKKTCGLSGIMMSAFNGVFFSQKYTKSQN